ncbi:hypothetical protein [Loktanella sp. M215]|uniref:hypothetical protein n=1 Tax=Loktanella sp. M215 TaxID=2675431 RepID=UPI001F18342C|nr:hypothetical protein [Loktanella sp. M215]MCF7700564.1 hypothetical protein [Loktanella sp. M215]
MTDKRWILNVLHDLQQFSQKNDLDEISEILLAATAQTSTALAKIEIFNRDNGVKIGNK